MKITETSIATIAKPENRDMVNIFDNLVKIYDDISSKNIILDLSNVKNINNENLSVLLTLINQHKDKKKSFVLIVNEAELGELDEKITAAPTLTEAEDLVEMENIERDLGF